MNRNIAPFGLRMPNDLKDWLQHKANENNRSLNAQIVTILQQAKDGQDVHQKLDRILEILEKKSD